MRRCLTFRDGATSYRDDGQRIVGVQLGERHCDERVRPCLQRGPPDPRPQTPQPRRLAMRGGEPDGWLVWDRWSCHTAIRSDDRGPSLVSVLDAGGWGGEEETLKTLRGRWKLGLVRPPACPEGHRANGRQAPKPRVAMPDDRRQTAKRPNSHHLAGRDAAFWASRRRPPKLFCSAARHARPTWRTWAEVGRTSP